LTALPDYPEGVEQEKIFDCLLDLFLNATKPRRKVPFSINIAGVGFRGR
jgi:hypothetical protein